MHLQEPTRKTCTFCAYMTIFQKNVQQDDTNPDSCASALLSESLKRDRKPRLVYITTHPIALRRLLVGQLAYFQQHGYEVLAVAAPGPDLEVVGPREGVQTVGHSDGARD